MQNPVSTTEGASRPNGAAEPRLVYLVLPPYEIPDLIVVSAIVVENFGTAPANNVKIALEYENAETAKIRYLRVFSNAEYILRGGGEQQSFATLRLAKLEAGQRVVIYFSGPTCIQPRVSVNH